MEYFVYFVFFMASLLTSIKEFFSIFVSVATVIATIIAIVNIRYTKKAIEHSEKQFNLLLEERDLQTDPNFIIKRTNFRFTLDKNINNEIFVKRTTPEFTVINVGNGIAKNVNASLIIDVSPSYFRKVNEALLDNDLSKNLKINQGTFFSLINDNKILANENRTIHSDYITGIKDSSDHLFTFESLELVNILIAISSIIGWRESKRSDVKTIDSRGLLPNLTLELKYETIQGIVKQENFTANININGIWFDKDKNLISDGSVQFVKDSESNIR
ncbi:hypothetical protein N5C46_22980 [Rossellomorea vietnamensis]|uniref:Uncharacterized protein n=1 Tax=Rossellomorea vietnamensis TaxID=218284 RepID=A0ACD4C6Z9_9BACI|nr:hypothetical protein [Rossellomorea vietnamensis]UXH44444.1 hypothetical protein N5C46_22980 [Rossellomorea vietnamensis]